MPRYQTTRPRLEYQPVPPLPELRIRRLRAAFVAQAEALPCRPEPRALWDDEARLDPRSPHVAARTVEQSRRAMRAALHTGDAAVIWTTRASIEDYYAALCEAALIDCPPVPVPAARDAHLALVRESSEAIVAATEAHDAPSRLPNAIREVREMVSSALRWLHSNERRPAQRPA